METSIQTQTDNIANTADDDAVELFAFDELDNSAQLYAHQAFNHEQHYSVFGLNKPIPYSLFAREYADEYWYMKDGSIFEKR